MGAARAVLAAPGQTPERVRYDGSVRDAGGYALYFTVVDIPDRVAFVVKVCEDVHGRVTGSADVSGGGESC